MKSAALQDSTCLPQVEMEIGKSALGHQLEALFSGDPEGNRSRATYALGARLHSNLELALTATGSHSLPTRSIPHDSTRKNTTSRLGMWCLLVTRRGIEPLLLP